MIVVPDEMVLNPDLGSPLNPEYKWEDALPGDYRGVIQVRSGHHFSRQANARGRVYKLEWLGRPNDIAEALRQWEHQYENGWFVFRDHERGRYFSGKFELPLMYTPEAYRMWKIDGYFVEIPNLPCYAYPSDWDNQGAFIEDSDVLGNAIPAISGASWTVVANPMAHGGHQLQNDPSMGGAATDFAKLQYFGYGFRLWSPTGPAYGIVELSVDNVVIGNIDLYSAAAGPTRVFTVGALSQDNLPLGFHSVKLRGTGTKNGASSSTTAVFDAVQVMR